MKPKKAISLEDVAAYLSVFTAGSYFAIGSAFWWIDLGGVAFFYAIAIALLVLGRYFLK